MLTLEYFSAKLEAQANHKNETDVIIGPKNNHGKCGRLPTSAKAHIVNTITKQ